MTQRLLAAPLIAEEEGVQKSFDATVKRVERKADQERRREADVNRRTSAFEDLFGPPLNNGKD